MKPEGTLHPQLATGDAAARAREAVAHSAALAIQDAADALRNAATVASAAAAAALAQFVATGDVRFLEAVTEGGKLVDKAIADFAAIGSASARIVAEFPGSDALNEKESGS